MPNNGHYTLCPYYRHEKDKVLYCEDTSRRFICKEDKENHMVKYCDSAWERCPYAITISHVWEQINSDMARQKEIYLSHQVKAMKGELKKLNGRLNKLEKNAEKLETRKNKMVLPSKGTKKDKNENSQS